MLKPSGKVQLTCVTSPIRQPMMSLMKNRRQYNGLDYTLTCADIATASVMVQSSQLALPDSHCYM